MIHVSIGITLALAAGIMAGVAFMELLPQAMKYDRSGKWTTGGRGDLWYGSYGSLCGAAGAVGQMTRHAASAQCEVPLAATKLALSQSQWRGSLFFCQSRLHA